MKNASDKARLLTEWGKHIAGAAQQGAFGAGVAVSRIRATPGPRAGALGLLAGLGAGKLRRSLARDDCATLRQFIPWNFVGEPQVFMSGRYVRVEAGWPVGLGETKIRLGDIENYVSGKYANEGRWVAGVNENGATVLPQFNDITPHFLVSGTTGAGKSLAIQCALLQLCKDADTQIVLVDGKDGRSLKPLEHLPGVVGPCAIEGQQIRNALAWAVREMTNRSLEGRCDDGRVIVVVDEFQELTQDQVIVDLLRKLAAQGRDRHVHTLLATQHPDLRAFGDTSIRRNLPGKIALLVGDQDASRVAVGGQRPRADKLLGAGDSYAIAPGNCHRVQLAFTDEKDIAEAIEPGGVWKYAQWPDYDDVADVDDKRSQFVFTGDELGIAVESAVEGEGRDLFTRRMEGADLGKPGYNRQKRLRELGEVALEQMRSDEYDVIKTPKPKSVAIIPDEFVQPAWFQAREGA